MASTWTGQETCTLLEDGTIMRYYRAYRTEDLHTVRGRAGRENCALLQSARDGRLAHCWRADRTGKLHTHTHGGQGGTFALLQDEDNETSAHCYREDRKGHTHPLIGRSGNLQLQYCGIY